MSPRKPRACDHGEAPTGQHQEKNWPTSDKEAHGTVASLPGDHDHDQNARETRIVSMVSRGLITAHGSEVTDYRPRTSRLSPISVKPARVEYCPSGHSFLRPRRALPPSKVVISAIMEGSMRG